jgi:hypothetical protein
LIFWEPVARLVISSTHQILPGGWDRLDMQCTLGTWKMCTKFQSENFKEMRPIGRRWRAWDMLQRMIVWTLGWLLISAHEHRCPSASKIRRHSHRVTGELRHGFTAGGSMSANVVSLVAMTYLSSGQRTHILSVELTSGESCTAFKPTQREARAG